MLKYDKNIMAQMDSLVQFDPKQSQHDLLCRSSGSRMIPMTRTRSTTSWWIIK